MKKLPFRGGNVHRPRCAACNQPIGQAFAFNTNPKHFHLPYYRYADGERKHFIANGREGQTLLCLVFAGSEGITALEVHSWAVRLSAYIRNLRKHHSLDIQTRMEGEPKHGRYVLITPIELEAERA